MDFGVLLCRVFVDDLSSTPQGGSASGIVGLVVRGDDGVACQCVLPCSSFCLNAGFADTIEIPPVGTWSKRNSSLLWVGCVCFSSWV